MSLPAHAPNDASEQPIVVLIADGNAAFRAGIRTALEEDGFVICTEAADAASAIAAALREQPAICLVDVGITGGGLHVVASIARRVPTAAIVVLTSSSHSADLLAALERGASGYLLKGVAGHDLAKSLRAAHLGEPAISRSMVPVLLDYIRGRSRRRIALPDGPVKLTAREWDVAELLRGGLNTAELSHRLGVSPVTVRRHIGSLVKKLGAPDRAAAIRVLKSPSTYYY
jgi:two-component system, NarL family, nitrate/nitrite response regulator NarL